MKKYFLVLFAGCLLIQFSCKTKKVDNGEVVTPVKKQDAAFLMDNLIQNQVNADFLSSRIKLGVEGENVMNVSLTGTLRMEKDKAIWVSLKKFGFEVARALITPDSVYVLDRLQGNNTAEDIGYVQRKMNFPANFQMLQAIVLGNPVFFTKDLDSKIDSTGYQLWSNTSNPKSSYNLNGTDMSLKQMKFDESNPQRVMTILQDNYQTGEDKRNFSYLRNIFVQSKQSGNLNLKIQFSNVEFDVPKNMPFTKPKLN